MNLSDLFKSIDERFEMYADKQISLEELRSFTRLAITDFIQEISAIAEEMEEILERK